MCQVFSADQGATEAQVPPQVAGQGVSVGEWAGEKCVHHIQFQENTIRC